MKPEEANAHRLVAELQALGVSAQAMGKGVHWRVVPRADGARGARVSCFEYTRSGLSMGMNPANARETMMGRVRPPPQGPEYMVRLEDAGEQVADGRTAVVDLAAAAVQAWMTGKALADVVEAAPFVGERRRRRQQVLARLDPALRHDLFGDPGHVLWVYGDTRSCRVNDRGCSFRLGQAQVAMGSGGADVDADAIHAWVRDGCSLQALADAGIVLEPHVEHITEDPARWHWLHLLDRIEQPRDVLVPLAPLIRRLAESPVCQRFYTFSSLNRLCFSASSHFPWVSGLAAVAPTRSEDMVMIDGEGKAMSVADAVRAVERRLAACAVEPFFGSRTDLDLVRVGDALDRLGSPFRPAKVQSGNAMQVVVAHRDRTCKISDRSLTLVQAGTLWRGRTTTSHDAIAVMLEFLQGEISVEQVALDVRIRKRVRTG